jgi:regulator of replication initiation timing
MRLRRVAEAPVVIHENEVAKGCAMGGTEKSAQTTKAIVISNYPPKLYEEQFLKKLNRYGVDVVRVVSGDRGVLGDMPREVTTVIALTGMMAQNQCVAAKEWAKMHGRTFLQLYKNTSTWADILGTPTLALVPQRPAPASQPIPPTWVEPQVAVETKPVNTQEANDAEELAKLYAIENAELRMKLEKLDEANANGVDYQDFEQLAKTIQKSGSALAAKEKLITKLQEELLRFKEETAKLKSELPVMKEKHAIEAGGLRGDVERLSKEVQRLEAELTSKRRTADTLEARMKQMVEEKKEIDQELAQARDKIAMTARQSTAPKEVLVPDVKPLQRLIVGLQSMIEEGMMTPAEAFEKLAAKYK